MTVAADSEVAGYLTRWKPARGTSPAAAAFARFVVAAAGPGSQDWDWNPCRACCCTRR
jgi:hypothetical protein